jgi:predicted porin
VLRLQEGGVSGSNWGIVGSRTMGNGLKAGFQLQGNLNLDTGGLNAISGAYPNGTGAPTSAIFNQIARVSLANEWGQVSLGRQFSPLYLAVASTDGREGRYSGSILSAMVGMNSSAGWNGTTTNVPLGAVYDDNAIVYTTPKMGGFTGNLEYVIGEIPGNQQAATRRAATLLYDNNGLKLSAAYYMANDAYRNPAVADATLNNRFWSVGAKYDLAAFTFSGSLSNGQNPSGVAGGGAPNASVSDGNANYNVGHFGLGYKISPMYRITSGYYALQDMNTAANKSTLIAVGLDIYLDAKTMFYVQGGQVANEGNTNMGIIYGSPVAAGVTTVSYMAGMRYSF